MAITPLETLEVIETMENFIAKIRPPKSIRKKLDIGYKIEMQSILIFEIRPRWDKPEIHVEYPVAKATYIKTKKSWKIFWLRANLKWYSYTPNPIVIALKDFTTLVEEDRHNCFWG
jgi:hypothetical protein